MFYLFAKIVCRFCIQIYYGKIEVNGLDNLPKDKPILLACNHPTGFLEPVIIACILDRPLHFITRGDLFSNKMLGPLLRATNQIPIWRFKDGIAGLRQNEKSIKAAENALQGGGALLMFVEGKTEDIKMLKPLQKGMARISTSLHQQNLTHAIIPVGINFIDTVTFRSKIMLNFGESIDPHPIILSESDPRKVYPQLNDVIFSHMIEQMLHCPDRSFHELHDKVIDIHQAKIEHKFAPTIVKDGNSFRSYKEVSQDLVAASDGEIKRLKAEIANLALTDEARHLLRKQDSSPFTFLQLILLLPFACLGTIVNAPPILLGFLTERLLVKSREFVAPIRFAASIGAGLIYYPTMTIIGYRLFGFVGLLFLLSFILLKVALYWLHLYHEVDKKYTLPIKEVERLLAIFTLSKNVK